ncbi:ATP-binding protein [Arthrobacter sp. 35/47]|uniref:ATP-binding protein n=1 Tax=Arthrobacter sp. 35/47 TaxID=269454 RepID=UPI00047A94A5|nr:ATP-binding protein [Arthrobacter sp. 35/47]
MLQRSANPFRPGAGRVPPELAGRDDIVSEVTGLMNQVLDSSEGERPVIISGLRGVGKTVLLNDFVRRAHESPRWIAIKLEATAGRSLSQMIALELHTELRKLMTTGEHVREAFAKALRVFRSFQLKVDPAGTYSFGFDVEPEPGVADTGDLERDIRELFEEIGLAARSIDSGVLIAIDELQEAPTSDLNALNVALHILGQSAWPVPLIFIGTGLPSLPAVLADATSYAERLYDYRSLDLLGDDETKKALVHPAEQRSVSWDPTALELAVRTSGGYPYFVQACGKHVWDVRAEVDHIAVEDAEIGAAKAREEVDRGLYQSRWERATPAQREVMKAMAEDADNPSAIQDLVVRTGKVRTSDLSVSRRELIKNGHIYAPDRGFVAFTVPGMADFIQRKVLE